MNAAAFYRLIQEIPYVTLRRKFLASPNLTHYDRLPNLQVNKTRKYWRTNKDQFPAQALRMKGVFVTYVGARVARSDESTSLPRMVRGSNPGVDSICGLSLLLVLSFNLLREVFAPVLWFSSLQRPIFPNSNSTSNDRRSEPLCGCAA